MVPIQQEATEIEILRLHFPLAVTQCNNNELTREEQSIMLGKREADDTVEVEHLCQGQHLACESMYIKRV